MLLLGYTPHFTGRKSSVDYQTYTKKELGEMLHEQNDNLRVCNIGLQEKSIFMEQARSFLM
jgi:hypothetical protein